VVGTGTWTHLAATYDTFKMRVFVDGRLVAVSTQSGLVSTNANPLTLGDRPGSGEQFTGRLDEVRILKRALSETEVAADYFGGALEVSTSGASGPYALRFTGVTWAGTGASATATAAGVALAHGAPNFVRVVAQDRSGNTAASPAAQVRVDTVAPQGVGDLAAVASGTEAVTLSWSAPGEDPSPLTGTYRVGYSTAGPPTDPASAQVVFSTSGVGAGQAQSRGVTGLLPNTSYHFRLWARDAVGNTSPPSNGPLAVTHPAGLDGAFIETVYPTSATVAWSPLPEGAASIVAVEASTATDFTGSLLTVSTTLVTVPRLRLTGLVPGATYHLRAGTLSRLGVRNFTGLGPVTTTAQELGVVLSVTDFDLGPVGLGAQVLLSTGVTVAHVGNVIQTYHLQASTANPGSPWEVAASTGTDRVVLWGLFNGAAPASGVFGSAHVLVPTSSAADQTRFALGQTGAGVDPGDPRTLWLKLATPLVTSTTAEQRIEVVVTAVAAP